MEQQQNGNGSPPSNATIGPGAAPAAPRARWDPKGRRNIIIVGSVIGGAVLLVVLMSFMGGGAKEEGKVSAVTPSSDERPVGNGMLSNTEKAALQAEDKARLDEARAKGESAIGKEMSQSGITLPQGQAQGQGQSGSTGAPGSGQPAQRGEQRLDQKDGQGAAAEPNKPNEAKLNGLTSQMEMMMKAWGVKPNQEGQRNLSAYSRTGAPTNAVQGSAQAGSGNSASAGLAVRDPNEQPVIGAFEQPYGAETLGPIDTDTPGKLRARILTGPLSGGTAIGTARRIGTQGVQLEFNTVVHNGRPIKVSAYGVDIENSGDVVQGNYDGRYMQRYVFPILSEGVRAYATARAQTGTQVVAINLPGSNGQVTGAQQTPPPTAEQARQAMIAAGANQVSQVLRSGPQDGHITLDVKTQFAIVFEQPIYQSDLNGQVAKPASK